MPRHPMSGSGRANPANTPGNIPPAAADDTKFETDLAELAARFTAQSGGGLSPELSKDLALQIVLNEIVEQACLATGATGAAVVLRFEGEMVCRASSGATAPELGARLDSFSGLSGECMKTRLTQRCDDVTRDPRADLQASSRLGIRSILVMPLLRGPEFIGLFEVFSSRVGAFGDRDELTLEALAQRVLSNIEKASKPLATAPENSAQPLESASADLPPDVHDPLSYDPLDNAMGERPAGQATGFLTWVLGLTMLFGAVWMSARIVQHLGWGRVAVHARSAAVPANRSQTASNMPAQSAADSSGVTPKSPSTRTSAPSANSAASSQIPSGGLLVSENGREVFRMVPSSTGMQQAASVERESVVEVSPAAAEGILRKRVEPDYPEAARQQGIQGPVVLEVRIGQDGGVQDTKLVSGDPLLAQAAQAAVQQWRFKPRLIAGQPAAMQTTVTLNFRLPQ